MFWKKRRNEPEAGKVIVIRDAADDAEPHGQELTVTNAESGELVEQTPRGAVVSRVVTAMVSYRPKPITPPILDPDFEELPVVPRVAEVCRISAARLLYAVSPDGGLQAGGKWCVAVLCMVILAAMVLSVTAECVTYVLTPVELATLTLQKIGMNLLTVTAMVFGGILIFSLANILIHGAWTLSKSKIVCAAITLVVLAVALIVGLAFGLEWFDTRFSGTFESVRGWAEFFRLVPKKWRRRGWRGRRNRDIIFMVCFITVLFFIFRRLL